MKKELLIPILILALTIAFAVVSVMVFLNGGKSATLVRRKLRLGALLLTFNAMIWGAKAQDEVEVSCYLTPMPRKIPVFFGLNFSVSSNFSDKLKLPNFYDEPVADYGFHGSGLSIGGFYWLILGDIKDFKHSLMFILNYTSADVSQSSEIWNTQNYIDTTIFNSGRQNQLTGKVDNSMKILEFKVLYNYWLFDNVNISIGPNFAFVLDNRITERISIDESARNEIKFKDDLNPVKYEDNNNSAILFDEKPPGTNDFIMGLNFEISYEIITGTGFDLLPFFGVSSTITHIVRESDWNMQSIYGGLSIRYHFLLR